MENTELSPAEFADSDNGTASPVTLSPRTLELIEILMQLDIKWQALGITQVTFKWQDLARMLKGAWGALESKYNPDMLPQAAHSMRELIEKAYYVIGEVSDKTQDPSALEEGDGRRIQLSLLVEYFVGNDGQTSRQIIDAQTDAIFELRQYFVEIAHHSSKRNTSTVEEMKQKISDMEEIIFNLLSPQPIEDLDKLDALMAQGEST